VLRRFSHVMLFVKDVSRAAKWYGDAFGFVLRNNYAPHYAILWHEGMKYRLDLHPDHSGKEVGRGAQVYFVVDDLDGELASLRAKGITVTDPRSEGGGARFSVVTDGEGNFVGITEEATR
jgi:predicted enzyme related to lactoylglutathione lyase